MINIAINGFGRIGRNILRAFYERPNLRNKIRIVAVNDLGDISINAHLLKYDTVHGRFNYDVGIEDNCLNIEQDRIHWFSEKDPTQLPWAELDIDIVYECTGVFTSRETAAAHLESGAQQVLISAPGKNADATIVFGTNHDTLIASHKIVSNASCTTNCLAPLVKPLHQGLELKEGFVTTVHAFTNDQQLSDVYHADVYRARSATQSMIPTKTGAAKAIGLVIPDLAGRLNGLAVRIPTINVSLIDLTFNAGRDTSVEEVNQIMQVAAAADRHGVLDYCVEPLVSADFNHCSYSCTFDAAHTAVNGSLVKVMAWYDNEWGFSNRMLDTSIVMREKML
ncbi:MAG: type I glyceraldehyde-3-phosphate dehydrogenase [Cellvibrionales bacterium TMED49]|nr:MAG: type I glyceraldehyde-3-phosphate dehydrogenase [Cellvibrionales bacterium TMED49]